MDYSAVLVTVKARSLSDIPHALAMYGFDGLGTIADISIIRSEPLPGFPLPGGHGENGDRGSGGHGPAARLDNSATQPPQVPHVASSDNDHVIELPGGRTMWGAHAPVVRAVPIPAKPSNVQVKLFLGFFEVQVSGQRGAKGFYKLPLAPRGSGRMLVANFVSCSIGQLHQVATVGRGFLPVLSVDVICRDPGASYAAPAFATL
jgi:hypothetical protein